MNDSNNFKQLYLDSELHHQQDLDKIKDALSNITDNSYIDTLLDTMNYTNAIYNVLKMQYLILYITLYLNEKKIIQNDTIPINTSLKILSEQDWITDNTKSFLAKHLSKVLSQNLDYSEYVKDIDTYYQHADIFR